MEEPGGLGGLRRRWEHPALRPDQGAERALPAVPALSQDRNPELVGVNEPVEAHYVGPEGAIAGAGRDHEGAEDGHVQGAF